MLFKKNPYLLEIYAEMFMCESFEVWIHLIFLKIIWRGWEEMGGITDGIRLALS